MNQYTVSSPRRKFNDQRANAKRRGVEWSLTFEDWWQVWSDSGKWEQRGRNAGNYVMARNGDTGPYSKDNVSVCLISDNVRQAWASGRTPAPPSNLGKGRGWTFHADCTHRPYRVMAQGRHIGGFATQEEAEAAYKAATSPDLARSRSERDPLHGSAHLKKG